MNQDVCVGSATCVGLCGAVFELDDNYKSQITEEYQGDKPNVGEVPDDMECVKTAERQCPVEAIVIEEESKEA